MITNIECTGCGTCSLVCPQKCITIKNNINGFLEPVIDFENCVNCKLCEKQCPQNKEIAAKHPLSAFAAWSNDIEDLRNSASGGAGAIIARTQFEKGSIVFGCDYGEDFALRHFQAKSYKDIDSFRSSKYSQSSAYLSFCEILNQLQNGKRVVFFGTPCQIAGLQSFLNKDFDNLITIDLVCHGAPPTQFLQDYLKQKRLIKKATKIRFRGQYDKYLTVWNNDIIIYKRDKEKDVYYSAFYSNIISYDSCYHCKYAKAERISDITLGDFWGLGKLNLIEQKSDRPSLVLINTEKGKNLFDEIKNGLVYEERSVEEAVNGNGRLICFPGKNNGAKLFQFLYPKFGFKLSARLALLKYKNNKLSFFVFNILDKIRRHYK